MRISFERTGGFGGMRLAATVDSESLSPQEGRALRDLVVAADFFKLPSTVGAPAADRFIYRITVEAEGRWHTVEMGEAAMPPALRPFVDWLTVAARKAQRAGTG